jgi:hypothetical protein
MKSIRNEIKHMMRAVTVLAIFTMTFVLAGNAHAVVIGPLGDSTVVQAPLGTAVSPLGVKSAILNQPFAAQAFVRPPVFNPFFRPAFFNPFFRPAFFNPFFRPAFFNPFFGADVDVDLGVGVGIGAVD